MAGWRTLARALVFCVSATPDSLLSSPNHHGISLHQSLLLDYVQNSRLSIHSYPQFIPGYPTIHHIDWLVTAIEESQAFF